MTKTSAKVKIASMKYIQNLLLLAHETYVQGGENCGDTSIFLVSYVISKMTNEPILFGGEGMIRHVYFFILISHILLSIPVLPLALFSIYRAMTGEIEKHKAIVRWTFPIWMYVAITGVLVYLLMSPYY